MLSELVVAPMTQAVDVFCPFVIIPLSKTGVGRHLLTLDLGHKNLIVIIVRCSNFILLIRISLFPFVVKIKRCKVCDSQS